MIYADLYWIDDKRWIAEIGDCIRPPEQSLHISCIIEQREYKTEYMASVGLEAMWNKWLPLFGSGLYKSNHPPIRQQP